MLKEDGLREKILPRKDMVNEVIRERDNSRPPIDNLLKLKEAKFTTIRPEVKDEGGILKVTGHSSFEVVDVLLSPEQYQSAFVESSTVSGMTITSVNAMLIEKRGIILEETEDSEAKDNEILESLQLSKQDRQSIAYHGMLHIYKAFLATGFWNWMNTSFFVPAALRWKKTKGEGLWIYGPPNCGKTSFIEGFLEPVFPFWRITEDGSGLTNNAVNSRGEKFSGTNTSFIFMDDFNLNIKKERQTSVLQVMQGYLQNWRVMYSSASSEWGLPVIIVSNYNLKDETSNIDPVWKAAITSRISRTIDFPVEVNTILSETARMSGYAVTQLYRLLWNIYYTVNLQPYQEAYTRRPEIQNHLRNLMNGCSDLL
jgi:hypothetical protein